MLEKARFLDVFVIISVYLWRFVDSFITGFVAVRLVAVLPCSCSLFWFGRGCALGALGCAVALRGSVCPFNALLMRGR